MNADEPCSCPRSHHAHGTWHRYANDNCRCDPCRKAWTRYYRQLRKRRYLCGGSLLVNSVGVSRRLQALSAVGWGSPDVARELGVTKFVVDEWRRGEQTRVSVRTHARIAGLYDRLWAVPSPGRYQAKVRRYAAAQGWVPPLAWDDDDGPHGIDNPDATPSLPEDGRAELAPCGTRAAYRRHYRRGEPACRDCNRAHQEAKSARRGAA